jgi:hypothetical protein
MPLFHLGDEDHVVHFEAALGDLLAELLHVVALAALAKEPSLALPESFPERGRRGSGRSSALNASQVFCPKKSL